MGRVVSGVKSFKTSSGILPLDNFSGSVNKALVALLSLLSLSFCLAFVAVDIVDVILKFFDLIFEPGATVVAIEVQTLVGVRELKIVEMAWLIYGIVKVRLRILYLVWDLLAVNFVQKS